MKKVIADKDVHLHYSYKSEGDLALIKLEANILHHAQSHDKVILEYQTSKAVVKKPKSSDSYFEAQKVFDEQFYKAFKIRLEDWAANTNLI
jgi:hypothetical protein